MMGFNLAVTTVKRCLAGSVNSSMKEKPQQQPRGQTQGLLENETKAGSIL